MPMDAGGESYSELSSGSKYKFMGRGKGRSPWTRSTLVFHAKYDAVDHTTHTTMTAVPYRI